MTSNYSYDEANVANGQHMPVSANNDHTNTLSCGEGNELPGPKFYRTPSQVVGSVCGLDVIEGAKPQSSGSLATAFSEVTGDVSAVTGLSTGVPEPASPDVVIWSDSYEKAAETRLSDALKQRIRNIFLTPSERELKTLQMADSFALSRGQQRCRVTSFELGRKGLIATECIYPNQPVIEYKGYAMLLDEYTQQHNYKRHLHGYDYCDAEEGHRRTADEDQVKANCDFDDIDDGSEAIDYQYDRNPLRLLNSKHVSPAFSRVPYPSAKHMVQEQYRRHQNGMPAAFGLSKRGFRGVRGTRGSGRGPRVAVGSSVNNSNILEASRPLSHVVHCFGNIGVNKKGSARREQHQIRQRRSSKMHSPRRTCRRSSMGTSNGPVTSPVMPPEADSVFIERPSEELKSPISAMSKVHLNHYLWYSSFSEGIKCPFYFGFPEKAKRVRKTGQFVRCQRTRRQSNVETCDHPLGEQGDGEDKTKEKALTTRSASLVRIIGWLKLCVVLNDGKKRKKNPTKKPKVDIDNKSVEPEPELHPPKPLFPDQHEDKKQVEVKEEIPLKSDEALKGSSPIDQWFFYKAAATLQQWSKVFPSAPFPQKKETSDRGTDGAGGEAECSLIVYKRREQDPMANLVESFVDEDLPAGGELLDDHSGVVGANGASNFNDPSCSNAVPSVGSSSPPKPSKKRWLSQALMEEDQQHQQNPPSRTTPSPGTH
ncbi:hypothetical protein ECG_07575 [Echinococcus granulosus]|nr:hypothetical protein ECG_07575 [Echinococcus granulosus]